MTVRLKRGDTRTALRATLIASDGTPADLTGASVRFLMTDTQGDTVISRQIDVVSPSEGKVLVVFEPGETAQSGLFLAEFEVTWLDGRIETFPNGDYVRVEILPDLG